VRNYDPQTGRFLQPDAFKGYLSEPASQNPYMYCRGNPVKYSDPSGYFEYDIQSGSNLVENEVRFQKDNPETYKALKNLEWEAKSNSKTWQNFASSTEVTDFEKKYGVDFKSMILGKTLKVYIRTTPPKDPRDSIDLPVGQTERDETYGQAESGNVFWLLNAVGGWTPQSIKGLATHEASHCVQRGKGKTYNNTMENEARNIQKAYLRYRR
jgi:hypothetical protein